MTFKARQRGTASEREHWRRAMLLVAVRASNYPHTQQPPRQTPPPLLTPNILTDAPAGVRAHRISLAAAPSTALATVRDLYYRYRKTSACAHQLCSRELHPLHSRIGTLPPRQQRLWASKSTCVRHTRTPKHHLRPWRRRPLRVALSRYTAVSAFIRVLAWSHALLYRTPL